MFGSRKKNAPASDSEDDIGEDELESFGGSDDDSDYSDVDEDDLFMVVEDEDKQPAADVGAEKPRKTSWQQLQSSEILRKNKVGFRTNSRHPPHPPSSVGALPDDQ